MMIGTFSQNIGKLFSELKLVTHNLSIYEVANWEATEKKKTLQEFHEDKSWDQLCDYTKTVTKFR